MTPTALLAFMNLFPEFRASSWDGWRAVLGRLTDAVREFYAIVGRGAGKSRIVALLACFFASRSYPRAPGESIYIGVFAPDRKQAGITFRYILGLLRSVPALAKLIVSDIRDSIELSNGIIIEVVTASIAAPRGRAYALVIVEEGAFLPTDQSANPDFEILRSVRPALARVPGSLLAFVSSPYARRGVAWTAYQKHHGQPDGDVVLLQASTLELNPTFDRRAIEVAYAEDEPAARAEYGGEFRTDLESYVSSEAIARVVARGVRERAPLPLDQVDYADFRDPAGGSGGDSDTIAVAHGEEREDGRVAAVLDLIREAVPPFSPEQVTADFMGAVKPYGVREVVGDRYAGEWPREACRRHGIEYRVSERTKSEIYSAFLPALNSGRVELLDHPKLLAQLAGLERRTGFGGRDAIDHAPRGHDDLINAAAGALLLVLDEAAMASVPRLEWL